jgi:hypothetical protein
MTDDASMALSREIRARAQRAFGTFEAPAPEPPAGPQESQRGSTPAQDPAAGSGASTGSSGSPDFGAGAGRRSVQRPPSMSDLIRAAFYGQWRRT